MNSSEPGIGRQVTLDRTAPSYLLPHEVCAIFRMHMSDLVRLTESGYVKAYRAPAGDTILFRISELDEFMTSCPAQEAIQSLQSLQHLVEKEPLLLTHERTITQRPPSPQSDGATALVTRLEELLSEHTAARSGQPQWLDAKAVKVRFGLDARRLGYLVQNGHVSKVKMGDALQAKSLYSAEDIDRALHAMASGRPLKSALVGKRKRDAQ